MYIINEQIDFFFPIDSEMFLQLVYISILIKYNFLIYCIRNYIEIYDRISYIFRNSFCCMYYIFSQSLMFYSE